MSLHHEPGATCPLCSDKLKSTHPILAKWFLIIKGVFPRSHISWSYRGEADQNKAFLEGASDLKYPDSMHNKVSEEGLPRSLALDLFELVGGQAKFPQEFYSAINALSAKLVEDRLGGTIRWGGTFKTRGDANHFELSLKKGV